MLDLVIEGNGFLDGKINKCCIGIDEGKIVALKKILKGDKHLDYGDKLIMPAGLDIHTHFRDPGYTHKENFQTGTQAAAFGGISYIMDMPNTKPPVISASAVKEKLDIVRKKACIDFGLYASIRSKSEVKNTAKICSAFKIFLGSTTGELLFNNNHTLPSILLEINSKNRIPAIHAESQRIIQKQKKYQTSIKTLHDHLRLRPNIAEVQAISRLLNIAKRWIQKNLGIGLSKKYNSNNNKLKIQSKKMLTNRKSLQDLKMKDNLKLHIHICHVSTYEGINKIRNFKKKLQKMNISNIVKITCEVTPHHLLLNEKYKGGSLGKVNPPLRTPKDQNALWIALLDGTVDILASDHAPHTFDEKQQNFKSAPAGIPGVETILPLMLSHVKHKHLSLNDLIRVISYNPGKIFKVPKGRIALGFDADLAVVDFYKENQIKVKKLHSKCGWTPYEKYHAVFPILTVVRGNIVIENDNFESEPGFGKFYN